MNITEITFPNSDTAKRFALLWGRATLRGHSMSRVMDDGSRTVWLYEVTEAERGIVSALISEVSGQPLPNPTPNP